MIAAILGQNRLFENTLLFLSVFIGEKKSIKLDY